MNSLIIIIKKIDCLKNKLDELRLSDIEIIKNKNSAIFEDIVNSSIREKYNSNEDQDIMKIAHREALDYIDELSDKNICELNKEHILNIHYLLFKDICPNYAGKFRDHGDSYISSLDEKFYFCSSALVPDKMDEYFNWLFLENDNHPLIFAAEAHNKLVSIHPFVEGNGRTGRLILNLILMQNGYTPIVIKAFKKEIYNTAIKAWKEGNKSDFYHLIAKHEIESLEKYFEK